MKLFLLQKLNWNYKFIAKSCGDLAETLNGIKEGTCNTYSCKVSYRCRPGFELVGQANHYCQHDGSWSPREVPACTGKYFKSNWY